MNAVTKDAVTPGRVIAQKENGIGWLIYDNPARRNAFNVEMTLQAMAALTDYANDPAVRVVIVRGSGDKTFIAGGDISSFEKRMATEESKAEMFRMREQGSEALRLFGKPSIAMIRGYCLGGGLGVALNCDLRICSEDAKFGIPAAKLSIGYGAKGINTLMGIVGPSVAKEILYTARQYTAAEALRMGLVNQVVSAAELESYTREYAEVIVNNAPLAILNAKTAVDELLKDPADRNMQLVAERAAAATNSKDHIEGRNAFLQKRKPVFTGT